MRAWVVFVLLWLGLAGSAAAETRVALVIGNSDYARVGALPNPKNDAALVADTLRGEGFDVSLVQDANRAAMLSALKTFADAADRSDWAVVYYAGHGIEVGGINYLLPTDSVLKEDRDVQDEAISLNRVLDSISNAHKLRLVILDACRNNPFAATMKRSVSVRAVDRGLAPVEPQAGIVVVYSAAAGQLAYDGGGEHSPFTTALVTRLQEPGLEVSRLFNVVTADVLFATGQHQRPFQYGSNPSREEYYFRPPAAAGGATDYDRVWSFLKTSQDALALKAFYDSLPAGHPLMGQVETRIAALASVAPPTVVAPKPSEVAECDRLAAAPGDPDLPAGVVGVEFPSIEPQPAITACKLAVKNFPDDRRLGLELGRAFLAAQNYADAKSALEVAAAAGSAFAATGVSTLYEKGQGVPQNLVLARLWLEKGAAAGDSSAMTRLGMLYAGLVPDEGQYFPKNYATARAWFEKAAAAGNAVAMTSLGEVYAFGWGVPQNFVTARIWLEKAAASGESKAMLYLGNIYEVGLGVPQNSAIARQWYEKSAALGNTAAKDNFARLAKLKH